MTEYAWQSLFAANLFITPESIDPSFKPEFTVIDPADVTDLLDSQRAEHGAAR